MDLSQFGSNIKLKWLDFNIYQNEIIGLRRKIFVESQGISENALQDERDFDGFHLGAFDSDELISIISIYVYKPTDKLVEKWELPIINDKLIIRLTKRAELPSYKGSRLAEFIATYAWKAIVDIVKPQCACLSLLVEHKKLSLYYTSFGFKYHKEIISETENLTIFIQDENQIRNSYLKIRQYVDVLYAYLKITPPSLVNYLEINDEHNVLDKDNIKHENVYLEKLSFKDELPRLLGQARLLQIAQDEIIKTVNIPVTEGQFLDIGCGPGVYAASLSKNPRYEKFKFTGVDISPEMISYAKLSYRNIAWHQRDVYETGFEDNTFDIVHSSFLFIHLLTPEIAIKEIYRILKKGGILYVVDVNDATFMGPNIISRMIQKHSQFYEGDRKILNILPELAQRNLFKYIDNKHITVNNLGSEDNPERIGNILKLGKVTLWAMFSFINQRKDIQEYYQKAEKFYFSNDCEISIQIQTQIFEKL